MHITDIKCGFIMSVAIIAGQVALALGSALASQIRGDDSRTVVFFGDGAMGEGIVYESLNFARLKNLPILFVCENNEYSAHMPLNEHFCTRAFYEIANAFRISAWAEWGMDVLKVKKTTKKALQLLPAFLQLDTYRFRGHVGPDDNIQGHHTDIRPESEVRQMKETCDPLKIIEKELPDSVILQIKGECLDEIEEAIRYAREAPFPDRNTLKENVYAT